MKVKKVVYTVLGFLFFGLGAVGTVLPILPTVPFLFPRSNEPSSRSHKVSTGKPVPLMA